MDRFLELGDADRRRVLAISAKRNGGTNVSLWKWLRRLAAAQIAASAAQAAQELAAAERQLEWEKHQVLLVAKEEWRKSARRRAEWAARLALDGGRDAEAAAATELEREMPARFLRAFHCDTLTRRVTCDFPPRTWRDPVFGWTRGDERDQPIGDPGWRHR